MEKSKIISLEEFKLKKVRKMSTNTSGKIDDLVREIEDDEAKISKGKDNLRKSLFLGEYDFSYDNDDEIG